MQDQHEKFESVQVQHQKKIEEIEQLKEKHENPKEKQIEMTRVYNELKTKHQKETNNLQQLQREIDRLNQITQTSEEFIKSMRNLTSIKGKTVPVEE